MRPRHAEDVRLLQLVVVDEHHRQQGEGRPPVPAVAVGVGDVRGRLRRVGREELTAGGKTVRRDAQQQVAALTGGDLLQQRQGAVGGVYLQPDAGAPLKLPHRVVVDGGAARGEDDQPVRVLRRRGVPVPAAAAQQEQYQQ